MIAHLSGSLLLNHEVVNLLQEVGPDLIGPDVDKSLLGKG